MERNFSPCSRGISGMEASDHQREGGGGGRGCSPLAPSPMPLLVALTGTGGGMPGLQDFPVPQSSSACTCMRLQCPTYALAPLSLPFPT